jgi:uncharacterized protein YukE
MAWTVDDPGVGDVAGMRGIATQRDTALTDVQTALTNLGTIVSDLPSSWSGSAADSHLASIGALVPELQQLAQSYTAHRDALTAYAATVETIQNAATPLIARIAQLESDLASLNFRRFTSSVPSPTPFAAPEPDPLFAFQQQPWDATDLTAARSVDADITQTQLELHQANLDLDALVTQRTTADTTCVSALSASNVPNDLTATERNAVDAVSGADLAAYLLTLSAAKRTALLLEDPSILERLKAAGPDNAGDVAALWVSIGPAAGLLLALKYPRVVGNLEGALYSSRDVANTKVLDLDLASLQAKLETMNEGDPGYDEVAEQIKAFKDIDAALGLRRDDQPPRYLVSLEYPDGLDSATPPLAAVALGDLDTADNTTYMVPGMDTRTGSSMADWTGSSLDVYDMQRSLLSGAHRDESVAVVAWVGYETPDKLTVGANDLAYAGADRLAAALDGFGAVQDATGNDAHLGVLAHSYGSTTAMLALQEAHGVDSFGVFGSAGQVADTEVAIPADQYYYVMGDFDVLAPFGQGVSQVYSAWDWLNTDITKLDEAQDPRYDPAAIQPDVTRIEGSYVSYYDENGDIQRLKPSVGTLGHTGYLDPGTSSLYNLSAAALGGHELLVENEIEYEHYY